MPTYDYICTSCHHAWELEQRIVEDPTKKCPKCKRSTAKRQISAGAGFILKGGGWYADGYGTKKPSSAESKPDEKGSKEGSKSEAQATADSGDAKKTKEASAGEGSGTEKKTPEGSDSGGKKEKGPTKPKKASAA